MRRTQRRRNKATAFQDISRRARVGLQEFAAQTKHIDQLRERLRNRKALRANIEAEPILFDGIDDTAKSRASFQQEHRPAELPQAPGARQP